jgi:hypothetical protein
MSQCIQKKNHGINFGEVKLEGIKNVQEDIDDKYFNNNLNKKLLI